MVSYHSKQTEDVAGKYEKMSFKGNGNEIIHLVCLKGGGETVTNQVTLYMLYSCYSSCLMEEYMHCTAVQRKE